jgi:hypothetical protein
MVHGRQQERTESPPLLVGPADPILFQEAREKFLRQVLGILR